MSRILTIGGIILLLIGVWWIFGAPRGGVPPAEGYLIIEQTETFASSSPLHYGMNNMGLFKFEVTNVATSTVELAGFVFRLVSTSTIPQPLSGSSIHDLELTANGTVIAQLSDLSETRTAEVSHFIEGWRSAEFTLSGSIEPIRPPVPEKSFIIELIGIPAHWSDTQAPATTFRRFNERVLSLENSEISYRFVVQL